MNKRITLLALISSIFYPLSAQKSLNIDSVFTISMEIQSLTPSRTYTVPANKIWKIETMGQTCLNMGNGRIELIENLIIKMIIICFIINRHEIKVI